MKHRRDHEIAAPPQQPSAKPTAQHRGDEIEKRMRILGTPAPGFFMREKPILRNANPACMNITSTPATITQVVFTADVVSESVGPSAAEATAGMASMTLNAPSTASRARLSIESPPGPGYAGQGMDRLHRRH